MLEAGFRKPSLRLLKQSCGTIVSDCIRRSFSIGLQNKKATANNRGLLLSIHRARKHPIYRRN